MAAGSAGEGATRSSVGDVFKISVSEFTAGRGHERCPDPISTQRASGLRPSRRSLPRSWAPRPGSRARSIRDALGLRWRLPQERLAHGSVSPVAG